MKIILIILNLLAAGLVFPAMNILHEVNSHNHRYFYAQLDRAQLIDQQRLEQYFPEEAKNPTTEMPKKWLEDLKPEWIVGYPCVLAFLLNATLLAVWRKPKSEPGDAANASNAASVNLDQSARIR
jgi:hypothetical protein